MLSISSRVSKDAPIPPCRQSILSYTKAARGSQSNSRFIRVNTDF